MKPIQTTEAPTGGKWIYEVKYDGFRAQLFWKMDSIQLISRNGHDMTHLFPEIGAYCREHQSAVQSLLPLVLDGELVVLNHASQANFERIQSRGRLKNTDRIRQSARKRPAALLAFDMLQHSSHALKEKPLSERKQALHELFEQMNISKGVIQDRPLNMVSAHKDVTALWKHIVDHKAEGMIAKNTESRYYNGKDHRDWYKVKNWRQLEGFLTFYNPTNGYYTIQVYDNEKVKSVGTCKHGLKRGDEDTLRSLFTGKGDKKQDGYALPPAICARINTLDLYKNELREPQFETILTESNASDCTVEKLRIDMAMLPDTVDIKHSDKIFWPQQGLTKGDLLIYMREIAPYMLPFLQDRLLTIIRAPDGVNEETFFQKRLPDYAPDFIHPIKRNGESFIVCNHLDALIWFANHGTIEYHTPFEKAGRPSPYEIVFDLDPPDENTFSLAIQAALMLKRLLEDLELISFVKTSGSKGMQVHIPIAEGSMSYEETATLTQAIAETMAGAEPALFTTERFKKERKGRLYIDYVQHAPGKTIITPYSPRLMASASVATPLHWDEVTEKLDPRRFTIDNIVQRVQTIGCPFAGFFETGQKQTLQKVKQMLDE